MELQSYSSSHGRSFETRKSDSMVVKGEFDRPLFVIIILLLCFGSIMVFSASYAYAYSDLDDSSYYIRRQMIFAALGIVAMLGISFISYKLIRKFTMLIYFVSIVLLILVLVIGISDGEAKRWLGYGSATFQPSEVAKFALVLILALFFEKHRRATLMRDYSISTYIKSFSIGTIIPFAIIMISCNTQTQ